MQIKSLEIFSLRNIEHLQINPSPKFNLIYGENASGKTSILEAIYLLGMGRSFRTSNFRKVIQNTQHKLTIHTYLENNEQDNMLSIGAEKDILGANRLRVSNQDVSIAEVARLLPIQIIHYDSFDLLNGHSKNRRQFFDWGMFHVKHNFLDVWRKFNLALQQRNKALQNRVGRQELNAWDEQYIRQAEQVHQLREEQFTIYREYVNQLMLDFELTGISLKLNGGWDTNKNLADILSEDVFKDTKNGFTQHGPHKADLIILHNELMAKDVLSRGQQKILITVLKLAQLLMVKSEMNKESIVLIDDLPAELDLSNLTKILTYLNKMGSQSFITAIDPTFLKGQLANWQHEMFHVKHGRIS
jgi:DNA replication and repair protein RecF